MTLLDLLGRNPSPAAWSEAENVPWQDPEFSEQRLAEHLSQDHDCASRRAQRIARQFRWLHEDLCRSAGFSEVEFSPSMGDPDGTSADGLFAIVATR